VGGFVVVSVQLDSALAWHFYCAVGNFSPTRITPSRPVSDQHAKMVDSAAPSAWFNLRGTALFSLALGLAVLLIRFYRRQRHRAQLTKLLHESEKLRARPIDFKDGGATGALLSNSHLTQRYATSDSAAAIQQYRSPLRSGDLAYAMSLPRPSLEPEPEPEDPHSENNSDSRTLDNSAVSSRGHITTAVHPTTSTAVRETNVFAHHPAYRRRVRTWDVGTVEAAPAEDESLAGFESGIGEAMPEYSNHETEDRLHKGVERLGTW
jgi:hypothetical protein